MGVTQVLLILNHCAVLTASLVCVALYEFIKSSLYSYL